MIVTKHNGYIKYNFYKTVLPIYMVRTLVKK